jgi:DNA repair exonuclease SbcCD ATPase subunit
MRFATPASLVLSAVVWASTGFSKADEAEELKTRARVVKSEAAQLLENGHKEEAEKLFQESKELMARAMELSGKKGRDHGPENPDLIHLKERLQELRAAREKAEAANAPEREIRELREQISGTERKFAELMKRHQKPEIPAPHRERVEELEQAARRIRHVRMAAENLKAAEMHDMASELMNHAEAMEKDLHAAKEELAHAMNASKKAHRSDVGDEIQQLRNENEHLRAELNGLRKAVDELREAKEK